MPSLQFLFANVVIVTCLYPYHASYCIAHFLWFWNPSTTKYIFHRENRYLLFLTENYAALEVLKHYIYDPHPTEKLQSLEIREPQQSASSHPSTHEIEPWEMEPFVLFGSSFPRDTEYTQVYHCICVMYMLKVIVNELLFTSPLYSNSLHTSVWIAVIGLVVYNFLLLQVCRNINQIKICMETGRMVVLLNLHNLYESLYDLLNQVGIWGYISVLSHYLTVRHVGTISCLTHMDDSNLGRCGVQWRNAIQWQRC